MAGTGAFTENNFIILTGQVAAAQETLSVATIVRPFQVQGYAIYATSVAGGTTLRVYHNTASPGVATQINGDGAAALNIGGAAYFNGNPGMLWFDVNNNAPATLAQRTFGPTDFLSFDIRGANAQLYIYTLCSLVNPPNLSVTIP